MTQEHPITLPPELVTQWWGDTDQDFEAVATRAARWGADQELEACCAWLRDVDRWKTVADRLRLARRPKPLSLKEQALQALANADGADHPGVATVLTADQHALIRKALEQLDD